MNYLIPFLLQQLDTELLLVITGMPQGNLDY